MLGSDRDENDPLARHNAPIAMDYGRAQKRPTRLGLAGRACDLVLGHAGVMLELERRDPSALVAALADEATPRAAVGSPARERFSLRGWVEIVFLDADCRHRCQPPVIGGKNATSFAPAIEASLGAGTRASAARTAAGLANARA